MIVLPKLLDIPGLNQAIQGILESIYNIEKATFGTLSNGTPNNYNNYNGVAIPHILYENLDGAKDKIYASNKTISQIDDSDFKISFEDIVNDLEFDSFYKIRTYIKASNSEDSIHPTSTIYIDTYINDIENYMCKIYKDENYYVGTTNTFTISESPELVLGQIIIRGKELCFANLKASDIPLNNSDRYIIKIEGWKKI